MSASSFALAFAAAHETYRKQCEGAAQFLYAYFAVRALATRNEAVLASLNRAARYWTTSDFALLSAGIIELGKIFDRRRDGHNVYYVLDYAADNIGVFSKEAFAERRRGGAEIAPDRLNESIEEAFEPTRDDFRAIRTIIDEQRSIYNDRYKPLRDEFFAHTPKILETSLQERLDDTGVDELQRMVSLLVALSDALRDTFCHGAKLILRPHEHSVVALLDDPANYSSIMARTVRDTERVLYQLADLPEPSHTRVVTERHR